MPLVLPCEVLTPRCVESQLSAYRHPNALIRQTRTSTVAMPHNSLAVSERYRDLIHGRVELSDSFLVPFVAPFFILLLCICFNWLVQSSIYSLYQVPACRCKSSFY